jgi:hypothetical protein
MNICLKMPKIRYFKRRHNRYKSSKFDKCRRRWKFTEKQKRDSKTGLSRSKNDVGRSCYYGPLTYEYESPANGLILKSRCPFDCPICKGREPGCQGSPERTEKNLSIYQASVARAEQKLRQENDGYKRHLVFFRTLAYLYYLRTFTFSFRNPSQVFFSLYDQSLAVVKYPYYPEQWVAFQNRLDSSPFLTWKREKRCIVLSPNQRKSFMCIGGSSAFLAMHLVPSTQRLKVHLRSHILRRLFGQKSFRRLIQAGGLDPNGHMHQCCSKAYFGE